MSADDLTLDLGRDEDYAIFLALVPDWVELADGIDLTAEEGREEFRARLQRAVDEAVHAKAREAEALSLMPLPTEES